MSTSSYATLKLKLRETEVERDYYKSLVGAFMEGQAPTTGNSLQHMIFAQWGRKRIAEMAKTPTLLRGSA